MFWRKTKSEYQRGVDFAKAVLPTVNALQAVADHRTNVAMDPTDFDQGFADELAKREKHQCGL